MPNYYVVPKTFEEGEKFSATLVAAATDVKNVVAKQDMLSDNGTIIKSGETVPETVITLKFNIGEQYAPIFVKLFFIAAMAIENGEQKILPVNEINYRKVNDLLAQQPGLLKKTETGPVLPEVPAIPEISRFILDKVNNVEFIFHKVEKTMDLKDPKTGIIEHKVFNYNNFVPVKTIVK